MQVFTREELEALEMAQLREIAHQMNIAPARSAGDTIDRILEAQAAGVTDQAPAGVEVAKVAPSADPAEAGAEAIKSAVEEVVVTGVIAAAAETPAAPVVLDPTGDLPQDSLTAEDYKQLDRSVQAEAQIAFAAHQTEDALVAQYLRNEEARKAAEAEEAAAPAEEVTYLYTPISGQTLLLGGIVVPETGLQSVGINSALEGHVDSKLIRTEVTPEAVPEAE